jgi:hypothetical protein
MKCGSGLMFKLQTNAQVRREAATGFACNGALKKTEPAHAHEANTSAELQRCYCHCPCSATRTSVDACYDNRNTTGQASGTNTVDIWMLTCSETLKLLTPGRQYLACSMMT